MMSSPTSPEPTGRGGSIHHRQIPAIERQPDAHRRLAVEKSRAGDHRGLGGAVGVPDLAALDRQPGGQLGGQASPPKISSRTFSSDSGGHNAASVGTVDTTVMPRAVNHGPRSTPLRTRERGAGTRQAP